MGYLDAYSVVLADDHPLFRAGLRGMLEADGMRVLGEAADGAAALTLARRHAPDVLVVDLAMLGRAGLQALAQLADVDPDIRVVVLTVSDDERDVLAALDAGARGYLLKDTRVERLAGAIRQAAEGHVVLSGGVGERLVARVRREPCSGKDGAVLTPRETEVLRLIAGGAGNAAIGRELSISPNTVKQYVTNIFEKLGVRSRVQAAVHAARVGLV